MLQTLPRYTIISLLGFGMDCALFAILHLTLAVQPFLANMLAASLAVTFVYFASAKRVFAYHGRFLLPKFGAYVAYQATVIFLFSALIAWLASTFTAPALWMKIGIVPVQFIMNYIVLRAILRSFEPRHC